VPCWRHRQGKRRGRRGLHGALEGTLDALRDEVEARAGRSTTVASYRGPRGSPGLSGRVGELVLIGFDNALEHGTELSERRLLEAADALT
jgi:hypothetical protein